MHAAAIIRHGGKINGPTYADLDLMDALRAKKAN